MGKRIEIEIDPETEKMLAELQAGDSLSAIGERRGRPASWIERRLYWFIPRGQDARNGWDVTAAIQDYYGGMTQAQVARKYGVTWGTVCRVFKRRGVKTRRPGERPRYVPLDERVA